MQGKAKSYRIGARGSLLSVTQSTLIKNKLEQITGDHFEIIKIKTQGDQNTQAPLWQLPGKDFFTKELDQALVANEVDLVIHSYKDLGSDRPKEILLAAITERNYPYDILLIKQETIEKLRNDEITNFIVGTSSPRRIYNISNYLAPYLPHKQNHATINCKTLRGNVNTRIEKLQNNEYHAIVLAMAGLERLASFEQSKEELKKLINNLNFMILPASIFPPAASQGSLAIEIARERNDNNELLNKLQQVHCHKSSEKIGIERKHFQKYGGGCHLAVGIFVDEIYGYQIRHERGVVDSTPINQNLIENQDLSFIQNLSEEEVFIGMSRQRIKSNNVLNCPLIEQQPIDIKTSDLNQQHLFFTSSHCYEALESIHKHQMIWAAGTRSMRKLAQRGYWINGSADSAGHQIVKNLTQSNLIKLFASNDDILILTGDESSSLIGKTLVCYQRLYKKAEEDFLIKLKNVRLFYWTSPKQLKYYFDHYADFISVDAIHASGLGKTWEKLATLPVKKMPILNHQIILTKLRK